jgi:sulfur-oxidizing protein SoxY
MSDRTRRAPTLARRRLLGTGASLLAVALVRPAQATPAEMEAAIRALVGEAAVLPGKVELEIPPLVENGNAVPVTVTVDSPMTPTDHVRRIALFNEKNPQPHVAVFHLRARAGRAQVGTRMRLADSQTVTAIAELSDGSWWTDTAKVIVTLAACLES